MLAVLLADAVAADTRQVHAAVNAGVEAFTAALAVEETPAAPVRRAVPDRATWGLLPHQVAKAQAAQQLGGG